MANKEKTLTEKLRDWLDKQGYPLEMRVAQAFQNGGFDVIPTKCESIARYTLCSECSSKGLDAISTLV